MSRKKTYPIAQLIHEGILYIGDGYRAKNEELASHGLPFARGANINDGFLFDNADRFPLVNLSRIGNKASVPGDVVFTSKGTVGRFAYVTSDIERFVYSPQLCFWRILNSDFIDSRFLFYWMQSGEFYQQYSSVKGQTDMADYVSLSDQRRMKITLPEIDEQREIASILGGLDDKIELNRHMNATLEATARAVFKSWFVDFDPVYAKAEGRQPEGMDAEMAALFPDAFHESELGLLPRGWEVSTIGKEVRVAGGSTPSTKEPAFWDGGIHAWATPKDLSDLTTPVLLSTSRQITDEGLQQISSGLLPEGTVLLSSRAPIGYLAVSAIPVAINQGFIAMVCEERLSNYYTLLWTEANMEIIKGKANGTTFLEISKGSFRPIPVIVPSDEIMHVFNDVLTPLFAQIEHNERTSRTLAETRDALLPKLISGELPRREIEESG